MSAEGIASNAAGRRLKGDKAHRATMAAINAQRRSIEATGAKAIARCPEHGLHGERNECFVCYAPVELVAMVPASEVEHLRAHNEHLRATLSRLLIFARGNDHVLGIIHDALDWQRLHSPSPASLSPRAGESRALCADGSSTLSPGCAGPSLQETEQ